LSEISNSILKLYFKIFGEMTIAGIDVNEREIVIAYFPNISNNGKPKFERIKRMNDKEVLFFLLNKLRMNKIDEVAIENPKESVKKVVKDNN